MRRSLSSPANNVCNLSGQCIPLVKPVGFLKDVNAQGIGEVIGECGDEQGTNKYRLRRVHSVEAALSCTPSLANHV